MMMPRWMNASMGVMMVCGQLARRPALSFRLPATATRWSHSARRCGSRASDFTVRMPCTVSTRVLPFSDSELVSLPTTLRSEGRNSRMTPAITTAHTSTIQASVGSIQNSSGSRNIRVNMSRKVPISFPVRKSRIFHTWLRR